MNIQARWKGWLQRLGGRRKATRSPPRVTISDPLLLSKALAAHSADAGVVKLAEALADRYRLMSDAEAAEFFRQLVTEFAPSTPTLTAAARAYLDRPDAASASALAAAAESPRQELLRRLNTAKGGTALIVSMRQRALKIAVADPTVEPLLIDLRHLLASWFNRGFLEAREINWNTPAAILEKLIRYEAVHAIKDWGDLRGRVEGDRRCFAFFHPAMPDEPLIFVEVALTDRMSDQIAPLIGAPAGREPTPHPKAAIFYSISNCQPGLRNIQFGDFLIKQVVTDLRAQLPGLDVFATLSPIPGFRPWLDAACAHGALAPPELRRALDQCDWTAGSPGAESLRTPLMSLCARYLTGIAPDGSSSPVVDPVARFHLSNGAALERINWRADMSPNGIQQSYGMMVNYRYRPPQIDANQEAFAFEGRVQRSGAIATLLKGPVGIPERHTHLELTGAQIVGTALDGLIALPPAPSPSQ